jgi:hypothetical protein
MHANNLIELVYSGSDLPKTSAEVYDFGAKQAESSDSRRIRKLGHENALLTRMVSQIENDITQLRKMLARP